MSWKDLHGVQDRVAAFDQEHSVGGEPVSFRGWTFFPDGCTRDSNPLGLLVEPTDPRELAKNKARYREIIAAVAAQMFESRKREIQDHLRAITAVRGVMESPPPVPTQELEAELTELRDRALQARAAHHAAEKELASLAPPQDRDRQEKTDACKATATDALLKLADISL